MNEKYYLNEAMKVYKKQLKKGALNLINANAGSGKSTFVFNDLLNDTKTYIKGKKYELPLKNNLHKVLYICDTSMLKDSILQENFDISTILVKGGLSEAQHRTTLLKYKNGKVKVITYSALGNILESEANKYILKNWFDLIIFDEIHNLFKYLKRYDNEKSHVYSNVVNNLESLYKNTVTVALSATPNRLLNYSKWENNLNINMIFNNKELETIRSYNFEPIYTNCIFNEIKTYVSIGKVNNNGGKMLIYTNTIKKSEEYKQWFLNRGIKAEWLCSINNKTEIKNTDENGKEVIEKVLTMNDYQLYIRNRLLKGINDKHDSKGTLPDDLTVLIVNGGYETGWNLYDENVQIALIDDCNEDTHIQARNRIRHNIERLVVKTNLYDDDGYVLEKAKYGELVKRRKYLNNNRYRYVFINNYLIKNISDEYIGIKLTKELKDEMVYLYGLKPLIGENNFKNLCEDLKRSGYVIKKDSRATYIFNADEIVKRDSKKEVNKMNNIDNLKNWILNEWDKKRITVADVMDATDFGRKSFDNAFKDLDFINFLKDNRIKIGTIKGLKRTKYMFKY